MITNSVMLNFRHPASYLPKSNKIYLAEDGVTEIEGPGFADKRNFFVTILDPFDVVGLIKGRDKQKYWERQEETNHEAGDKDVTTEAPELKTA